MTLRNVCCKKADSSPVERGPSNLFCLRSAAKRAQRVGTPNAPWPLVRAYSRQVATAEPDGRHSDNPRPSKIVEAKFESLTLRFAWSNAAQNKKLKE